MPEAWIVVTHHRLPEERLRDFFAWNDDRFRARGIRVLVVSDAPREGLPDYARAVVYPAPLPTFSLSKTSNFGIRLVCGRGEETVVCKSDPDIWWPDRALDALLRVRHGQPWSAVYRMARSARPSDRRKAHRWDDSKGTLAMTARDWARLHGYDERQTAYGIEDGTAQARAIRMPGMELTRGIDTAVIHIAHQPGTPQEKGSRRDQWNRDTVNPVNRRANKAYHGAQIHADPWWGIPQTGD